VDSHVKNLRRKLARAGAPAGMIETVFGVGYRLAEGRRPDGGTNP
jgi:DNA-binding response OmpR family regulator